LPASPPSSLPLSTEPPLLLPLLLLLPLPPPLPPPLLLPLLLPVPLLLPLPPPLLLPLPPPLLLPLLLPLPLPLPPPLLLPLPVQVCDEVHMPPFGQSEFDPHCTHPALETHTLPFELFEQSLFDEHATHAFPVHTGSGLLHSVSFRHCTHEWLVVSQTPIEQSLFCTQATHCPLLTSHALFVPPLQSAFDVQPRHVCDVASQMGVEPEHCESLVHWTQAPLVEHTGVGALQSLFDAHGPQVSDDVQTGVFPEH